MKRLIFIIACAVAILANAQNKGITPSFGIMEDTTICVNFDMDLSVIPVKSNQTVVYTPYLANGKDTLSFPPVVVMGRRNYIQYERGNLRNIIPPTATVFKSSEVPEKFQFSKKLNYLPWFDNAIVSVRADRYGCALCAQGKESFESVEIRRPIEFVPSNWAAYVQPKAEGIKIRDIEGSANVEFPVNKTVLLSDFRNNYNELNTVKATIDVVKNDPNCTIKKMAIRGFASPEGSYENNTRLAKGRTEALCSYVEQLYNLPKGFIDASYEPEDWAGLRSSVLNLNINNKDAILSIIDDSDLDPDAKDKRIKSLYPEQYKFLLEHIYPALRHSDYKIEYEVKSFSNPEEILKEMRMHPKNLSLEELFVAAQSLEPGSPEFNEVFEVAVRLFPDSEEANLNAAINAMNQGNLEIASSYLKRAGTSSNADYTRAVLAIANKDYEAAEKLLVPLKDAGSEKASQLLSELEKIQKYNK